MRRRLPMPIAALVALAAALAAGLAGHAALAPAPAAAQDAVAGGATFTTAPEVEPGTYRDTVLPREVRIYAVRLAAGQQLRAEVTPEGEPEVFEQAVSFLRVVVRGPLRQQADVFDAMDTATEVGASASVIGPPAAADADGEPFVGPGLWFVTVHASRDGSGTPRVELPFTLGLSVEGEAEPEPEPEETATPAPTPEPRGEEPSPSPVEDDSPAPAAAAGVGLGSLALGALAGMLIARRRR